MIKLDKKKMEGQLKYVLEFIKSTEEKKIRSENGEVLQRQDKSA
jgi:hypothetical protein